MNSKLYNNNYVIPKDILQDINVSLMKYGNIEGSKRAKNLLKSGEITYQNLKRLKNFFDHFNSDNDSIQQYELAGGDKMKNFIEKTLSSERSKTKQYDKNTNDIHNDISHPMKTQNINVRFIHYSFEFDI